MEYIEGGDIKGCGDDILINQIKEMLMCDRSNSFGFEPSELICFLTAISL